MISFPEILLRLAVALMLGAVIGFEREQKEHAAGLRTLALVSLGCALFTIISAYGFLELLTIPHTTIDPTRIASYIVAGIGFLGGGTIFLSQQNEKVKGLTTAAKIQWQVAVILREGNRALPLEMTVNIELSKIRPADSGNMVPNICRNRCH